MSCDTSLSLEIKPGSEVLLHRTTSLGSFIVMMIDHHLFVISQLTDPCGVQGLVGLKEGWDERK